MTTKTKKIRRKVVKHEAMRGTRVPGWLLDLECGHSEEVTGWGDGSGIACPATTICRKCSELHRQQEQEIRSNQ